MKLKKVLIGVGLFLGLVALGCLVTTPLTRTRSYAQLGRWWTINWPLSRGKYLPSRFIPALESVGILQRVTFEVEPGVAFILGAADVVEQGMLASGTWDEEIWGWIRNGLPPGGTFVDVGAHIGTMTIRGAKAVGNSGKVLAVEPNPVTIAKLKANIKASGWSNIVIDEVACGSKPGELELFIGSSINSGTASLSKQNVVDHGAVGESIRVPIVRFDDLAKKAGLTRIDVMKMDVEGAEMQVLSGAMESIEKFRPLLVLETVDEMLRNMGSSLVELETALKAAGYSKVKTAADETNAAWAYTGAK